MEYSLKWLIVSGFVSIHLFKTDFQVSNPRESAFRDSLNRVNDMIRMLGCEAVPDVETVERKGKFDV